LVDPDRYDSRTYTDNYETGTGAIDPRRESTSLTSNPQPSVMMCGGRNHAVNEFLEDEALVRRLITGFVY
jgi:hypothetical protein